ncbi:hypothetical protein TSACC_2892 [Terrimicrobium sacchariphilum]|uniref:Lipoprotein n=1 Tax=Terrimicrobium sacchariphilum TaxID=690879 RepID=A0A146G4Z2_TERSA|nr:hypothetical protein [Terrimicrobium sacchariphilum]GAT32493.1 hypothetical protein TSACC_2892 [Terrimicrobium sacchariphilum]
MKRLLLHVAAVGVTATLFSSCVTQSVIATAKGTPGPMDPPDMPPRQPQPLAYALVPLVVPIDIVFWPIEYLYTQNQTISSTPPRKGVEFTY